MTTLPYFKRRPSTNGAQVMRAGETELQTPVRFFTFTLHNQTSGPNLVFKPTFSGDPGPTCGIASVGISPVVIFVHQVVACSESHQPGVVRRRRDGDGASAADVSVAQLVGEELQLISGETVVIPQDVVVGGTTGSLRTEHPGRPPPRQYSAHNDIGENGTKHT